MNKRLSLLLLICLALPAAAQEMIQQLPIKLEKGLIFFELSVNGSKNLTFLFDTGAADNVLNSTAMEKASLAITGESVISTSGNSVKGLSSDNNTLTLGDLQLENTTLEILPLGHLSAYFGFELDGVIGHGLFGRYIVETDIDKGVMNIYAPEGFDGKSMGKQVKIHRLDRNKMAIDITISRKGKKPVALPFTIDTAFDGYLTLFPQAADDHGLHPPKKLKSSQGFSADSTVTTNVHGKVQEVAFGGKSWKRVKTSFLIDPVSIAAFRKSAAYGLVGQDLLLDFNITYDYPNNRLFLKERD